MIKRSDTSWSLLLILLLAFTVAACSSKGDTPAQKTATPVATTELPTDEPPLPETTPADPAIYGDLDALLQGGLKGKVVKFWHNHTNGREEHLTSIVKEFNANNEYGIVVEASYEGGYGDIYDKVSNGIIIGELPGLVVAYQNQAASYMIADGLVSLDPYINHPLVGLSDADRADWFPSFLEADRLPQFGGQVFGWPPNRSMEVLYYNSDWLKELGYSAPPKTMEEFAEMTCQAAEKPFSKNADPTKTVGYEITTDASNFAALIFAQQGDIFDYVENRFTYNTPEAVKILSLMSDLLKKKCSSLIAQRVGDQIDFGNGQTLFSMGSTSGISRYGSAVKDGGTGGFEWSVGPIPYSGEKPIQNIYGASVSIPKTDPATQLAAWIFLEYFTSADVQTGWVKATNYFPVRKSVANGLTDYFNDNPIYKASFDLLPYSKTEPGIAGYDKVRDEVSIAYNRILSGEDVEIVLTELDTEANRILAESLP